MCLGRVGGQGRGTYGGKCCEEDAIGIRDLSDRPGTGSPAEMGMLLPDETYEARSSNALIADVDEIEAAKALAALRRCDEFLKRHGIRPEFFCRHRERLALQAWLLKRSQLYSGKYSGEDFLYIYIYMYISIERDVEGEKLELPPT